MSHGRDRPADQSTEAGQTSLTRNPGQRQVAKVSRDYRKPVCPDCGSDVAHTKSGGKPLPNADATAFGWSCEECNLTLPSNCHGPRAPHFNEQMVGIEVEFRDGETRYVPVPKRYVDIETHLEDHAESKDDRE